MGCILSIIEAKNKKIRKSSLEVLSESQSKSQAAYYFPAFEIANDVCARIPGVGFGNDDSNSRHLDSIVIHSICEYF